MELLTGIDSFSPRKEFLNFEHLKAFAMQYKSNMHGWLENRISTVEQINKPKKDKTYEFTAETLLDMLEFVRRYEDALFETKRLLFILIGVRARGAVAPLTRAKTIIFGQKLNFSGRIKPAAKNEKIHLYLLNEKNGIHYV